MKHTDDTKKKQRKLQKEGHLIDTSPDSSAPHQPVGQPSLYQSSQSTATGAEISTEIVTELSSEMTISRKPVGGYDINNPPRIPLGSVKPLQVQRNHFPSKDEHGELPLHANMRQPLPAGTPSMEPHDEKVFLRGEVRRLRDERDSYIQKLKASEELLAEALIDRDDSDYEPVKKDVQRLNKIINGQVKEIGKLRKENRELKSKINELEDSLKTQKAIQKAALDAQEKRLKREAKMVEHRLHEANKAVGDESARADNLASEKRGLEKFIDELQGKLDQYTKEIAELETTRNAHKKSVAFLEAELKREIVKSKERSADVRKAQESAFRLRMEPAKWMPKADTDVRRSLDKLSEDLWSWVKSSVRKDIDPASLNSDATQQIMSRLAQWSDREFRLDLEDKRYRTKIPMLICMATITTLLYDTIFKNPFFWQEETDNENTGHAKLRIDLFQIYMDAVEGKSYIFTSQL